jgi:hypothetical protein
MKIILSLKLNAYVKGRDRRTNLLPTYVNIKLRREIEVSLGPFIYMSMVVASVAIAT